MKLITPKLIHAYEQVLKALPEAEKVRGKIEFTFVIPEEGGQVTKLRIHFKNPRLVEVLPELVATITSLSFPAPVDASSQRISKGLEVTLPLDLTQ